MPVYWEQNVGGVQVENYDTKEEDEDCEIQKPHMQGIKYEEYMENFVVNIISIFDLQMINKFVSNNYRSEGFGMQRSKDDLLGVSLELVIIYTQTSRVFAQSINLLAQLTNKSIQSTNVWSQLANELTQLINEWTQSTEGVQGERSGVSTINKGILMMCNNQKMKFVVFIHNDDMKSFHVVAQRT